MGKSNQLKIKFTLISGEQKKIKTKKIFYGSLFFIFFSVLGSLTGWFFKISRQKIDSRLKIYQQAWAAKSFFQVTPLKIIFLLIIFNLSILGWLNKENVLPIAMGKVGEEIILGEESAVKFDDLQKESKAKNSSPEVLGKEKDLNLSLTQERCQKNKLEGKSSELCGKYEKDEALEKELKKIDDQAKARMIVRPRNPAAGKGRCAHPEDKPRKSKEKGKHMDEDCCPDPDEYPDPKCYYTPAGYALMLKR